MIGSYAISIFDLQKYKFPVHSLRFPYRTI